MTTPRIAFLGSSTAVDGGSELCLLRMAEHFHSRFPVTLFLPDEGPLFQEALERGIDTVNLRFMRLRKYKGVDWIRWWGSTRKAARTLREECLRREVSLIHFNDFIDLPFYSVAKDLKIPSVAHLRLILRNRAAAAVYRLRVRAAGCLVIPVSQAVAERMLGPQPRIPYRVVYDPAPRAEHFLAKQPLEPHTPFQLVMVSKLLENKGHLNYCRVALEIEKKNPGQFAYTMVAPSSPGREAYERSVHDLFDRLPKDRARFIPGAGHEELGKILRASDLLLHLPDTEDSFPGVVLEAMACGTPVLSYRTGGISEQLEGGCLGVLVEPGDLGAVLSGVERMANDPEEWRSKAEEGLKKVSTDFSAETHFRTIEGIYRELC